MRRVPFRLRIGKLPDREDLSKERLSPHPDRSRHARNFHHIDFGSRIVHAKRDAHQTRHVMAIVVQNIVPHAIGFFQGQSHQVEQIGMRAETAVAHAHAIFSAEDGRDQKVRHTSDVERDHAVPAALWGRRKPAGVQ